MTISPSITPANCFDRRSDAAVPTSVTPIRLIASRKMISEQSYPFCLKQEYTHGVLQVPA